MLFAFCATLTSQSLQAEEFDKLKGNWDYKAPYAPYEYSNGKFVFADTEGTPSVIVKTRSGSQLKAKNVKIEKENISFYLTVEGYDVYFKGKLIDSKISGEADTPSGAIDVTAERPKPTN